MILFQPIMGRLYEPRRVWFRKPGTVMQGKVSTLASSRTRNAWGSSARMKKHSRAWNTSSTLFPSPLTVSGHPHVLSTKTACPARLSRGCWGRW